MEMAIASILYQQLTNKAKAFGALPQAPLLFKNQIFSCKILSHYSSIALHCTALQFIVLLKYRFAQNKLTRTELA